MILALITLKHIFGPTYPFFRNPELRPTLRAVKFHFDRMWILKLKRFFLKEFASKNHLDKSSTYLGWILNFRVHNGTIKEKCEWKEKCDSRVKTRKGSLEQKWKDSKDSWAGQTKEWRVSNQEASKASTRSSIPFKIRKFDLSIEKCLFQTPESITIGLDACQIIVFRKKWIF